MQKFSTAGIAVEIGYIFDFELIASERCLRFIIVENNANCALLIYATSTDQHMPVAFTDRKVLTIPFQNTKPAWWIFDRWTFLHALLHPLPH